MASSARTDEITPAQSKAARGLLGWSARDLASRATVPPAIVNYFEGNRSLISAEAIAAIRFAFEDADIKFFVDSGYNPAVRLNKTATAGESPDDKSTPQRCGGAFT